jgi:GTP-binding protein YchF
MEKLGLVGLANSGKSTLYNALTGANTPVATHPFSTTETAVGEAIVKDDRLLRLAELHQSRKLVPAHIQVVDIAGLVSGSSEGAGLGNRFLGQIREVDGIVFVLRAFASEVVPGDPDPVSNLETVELELTLADLASVESMLVRRRKAAKADKSAVFEVEALERAEAVLSNGVPIYRSDLGPEDRQILKSAFLLTNKPVFAVLNIGEDDSSTAPALEKEVSARLGKDSIVVSASLKLEAELSEMDKDEADGLRKELGLSESALAKVTKAAYDTLGRWTFFTTGEKETHAWTFRSGATAVTCAGVIHSDLARGFIRAEVIGWEELIEIGSWSKAKAAGKLRLEGKDYQVKDGEVLEIRFNV